MGNVLLLAVAVLGAGCLFAAEGALLSADFETNPLQAGWTPKPGNDEAGAPAWSDALGHGSAHCITVADGTWASPEFAVTPFEFYRLEFFSKAEGLGYWATFYCDEQANILAADCHSSIYKSDDWLKHESCFRAHAKAVKAKVCFQPIDYYRIWIGDVSVGHVDRRAVVEWADALYATLPPLKYVVPASRGSLIPRAMESLKAGRRLRLVMLGDSIVNDTGNSPWDALLERRYPGARLEVVISVKGGTGCQYYKDENRVKEYVLDFAPDLVIIGGISHGYDAEAMRSVVRQIRAGCGAEILIMTGAVANTERCRAEFIKHAGKNAEQAAARADAFPQRVQAMAAEEKCEFLDLRSIWDEYVKNASRPEDWFRRDIVHANDRAKQILARVLERYFAP